MVETMRPMTRRERRAAQRAWNAFKPDKEYGSFIVCTKGERKRAIVALKEHMRETMPEGYQHRVSWLVKVVTPVLMSIGWSYSP